ncbi:phage tail assembly chaperone family protein, TAC [Vreelandella profundi]|uniref:phage tail assembly chaperone family protein, TAC n=1 Tax=Vreelandella profundi TaxID=2852117 RepID=UPI001F1EA33B|nr:phage tail assembly chaperone family protein, TAC [Halomonas profundi]
MKITLENLAANGGFVSRKAVEKEISWENEGQEFKGTVNVLALSYATAKSDIISVRAKGDPLAARIAYCIVDDDGQPVFTEGDITGEANPDRGPLSAGLTNALLAVIGDVSGLGKPRAGSAKKTSAGTSSSSTASAGARSKKRKSASRTPSS